LSAQVHILSGEADPWSGPDLQTQDSIRANYYRKIPDGHWAHKKGILFGARESLFDPGSGSCGGSGRVRNPGAGREPRPTDVSQHIARIGNGDLPEYAQKTLAVIDAVHTDGGLPQLRFDEATISGGPQARYSYDQRLIEVDPAKSAPHFALVHEIGHAIAYALGDGSFASATNDPALRHWRDAIYGSQGYLRILDYADRITSLAEAEYVNYAIRNSELWARSYAQYIAARSEDRVLLLQLRNRQDYKPEELQLQWHDEDFEDIASAIDGYFRLVTWII